MPSSPRALRRLLIVESDAAYRERLQRVAHPYAKVETAGDLLAAYSHLFPEPPALLITNLRIPAAGGLQLAYLMRRTGGPTRTIVYSEGAGPSVTRELQRVGAFFESQARLPYALPAYLEARLPVLDRRDPIRVDRRLKYRGGRRSSDVGLVSEWGGGDRRSG